MARSARLAGGVSNMSYVFPAPAQAVVPIVGSDEDFPVRRIYCVGRNYAAHAREMGFDPDREPPFFFTKPADAIVASGVRIPYPRLSKDVHYEVELVVAIGKGGADIAPEAASDHIFGYAVGIDLTRRDLQVQAREKGRPWDMGKAFDQSAPCAPLVRAGGSALGAAAIWLKVNGETKQSSDLSKLIWSVPEIVSELSTYVELAPGDLIYTGTPEGVGPVVPGDTMDAHIDGLPTLQVVIA